MLFNWELLFAKLLSYRRHGRRWRFLIDSFHELMRDEKPIQIESDPDDNSDDEDGAEALPQKNVPKHRRSTIRKRDVSKEAEKLDEVQKLTLENKRLKLQLEDFLSLKLTKDSEVQTAGVFVEEKITTLAPNPFHLDLNQVFRECGEGDAAPKTVKVLLRPKYLRGFADYLPAEVVCVLNLNDGKTGAFRERSGTTTPIVAIKGRDMSTIEQNLILTNVTSEDHVTVQLLWGVSGSVLAYGSIIGQPLIDALSGQVKSRLSENCSIAYTIDTTITVKMQVTSEYVAYRNEAFRRRNPNQTQTTNPNQHFIDFTVAIVTSDLDDTAAELQQRDAVADVPTDQFQRNSGRRKNRSRNIHHSASEVVRLQRHTLCRHPSIHHQRDADFVRRWKRTNPMPLMPILRRRSSMCWMLARMS